MNIDRFFYVPALLVLVVMGFSGCAREKTATNHETESTSASTASHDDHSGWWCKEHAIPEEECSMCSAKAAADFKAKGDWCEEHNRADSQCFICHPELAEKYAKLYEAKYGEKPPAARE